MVESAGRPLRDAAHGARTTIVLRAASEEFLRAGVAAADLPAIAGGVGLTRASLYNYCTGREDLARQCYLATLGTLRLHLNQASLSGTCGLDAVLSFVREVSGSGQPIAAIAAELDLLPVDARAEIEAAQTVAFDALAALIGAGIADGSIRPCDPGLAARTIWGLAFWTPLGAMWAGRTRDGMVERMAAGLPELIERGIVSDAARPRSGALAADMLDGIWDTAPDDRREEIARSASALFNRRGVEGVSLNHVAAAMGATKGLLYHHFDSKAELVRHCFERGFAIYDRILSRAAEAPDGLERVRRGIGLNAMAQLCALHPLSLNAFFRRLPEADSRRFTTLVDALLDRSVETARIGIAEGLLRDFDTAPIALLSAGAFLFLSRWIATGDADAAARVAAEISDLLIRGIRT